MVYVNISNIYVSDTYIINAVSSTVYNAIVNNIIDIEIREKLLRKHILKVESMDPILDYANNKPPLHWQAWRSRR